MNINEDEKFVWAAMMLNGILQVNGIKGNLEGKNLEDAIKMLKVQRIAKTTDHAKAIIKEYETNWKPK